MFRSVVRKWIEERPNGSRIHRRTTARRGTITRLRAECLEDRTVPAFLPPNIDLIDDPDGLLDTPGLVFPDPNSAPPPPPLPGSPPPPPEVSTVIMGSVFYDKNGDGQLDINGPDNTLNTKDDEPGIDGWVVRLYFETNGISGLQTGVDGDVNFRTETTVNGGLYTFEALGGGTFYIAEDPPPFNGTWLQTKPSSASYHTVVNNNEVTAELPTYTYVRSFGNVRLQAGYGLGYWTSPQGRSVLQAHDAGPDSWRNTLNALNLRDADGSHFDVPTQGSFDDAYRAFRDWLRKANATNMAYMLSAQTAAMALNVGYVIGGDDLTYAPGARSANQAGYASVGALLAEADAELGLHGHTRRGDPAQDTFRDYQEALKTIFDESNNGQLLIFAGLVFDAATGKWVAPTS